MWTQACFISVCQQVGIGNKVRFKAITISQSLGKTVIKVQVAGGEMSKVTKLAAGNKK
jgi:hypothetical protein